MSTVKEIIQVAPEVLHQLRAIDSCTVSNAIERLDVRLRNEGFADSCVQCFSPELHPMVGYAATGRIRSSVAPTTRHWYYNRMDWWAYILTIPEPRVIVLQDVDDKPGLGALFGEIHANISRALGCIGYVTNGTVRDVPGIKRTGFHLFASAISVSHAYAHVVDFGGPVQVGGLTVHPGDLLHGDMHGVLCIPPAAVPEIPRVAKELLAQERELIQLCQSQHFSLERLREQIENTDGLGFTSNRS
jgi:4-hydroxy-4-methyl-2-oxoglutarate aldolase